MATQRKSRNRKPTLADRYMGEMLDFGGIMTRRNDVLKRLEADGLSPREIDYWMIGHDGSRSAKLGLGRFATEVADVLIERCGSVPTLWAGLIEALKTEGFDAVEAARYVAEENGLVAEDAPAWAA